MPKKIDYSKLSSKEIAALDFRGDLKVRSRIRAGVAGEVEGGTSGYVPPPPPGSGGLRI